MTMLGMYIACWIFKATGTHSEYVLHIAFPLQQLSHEPASLLRYTYISRLFLLRYFRAFYLLDVKNTFIFRIVGFFTCD